jgi:hypothetical protein
MLSEMEVTAQAFEDMQEQNARLLQQLQEKEDANLKLMSEVKRYTCVTLFPCHSFEQLIAENQIDSDATVIDTAAGGTGETYCNAGISAASTS